MELGKFPRVELRQNVPRVPKCATRKQYMDWLNACKSVYNSGLSKHGFCTDCTVNYQRRMINANRCENPELQVGYIDD